MSLASKAKTLSVGGVGEGGRYRFSPRGFNMAMCYSNVEFDN